jgi:outer membrane biosynthesis protein TonB
MHEAVDDVIQRRRMDPDGLGRLMSASIGVHVAAILVALVLPRAWPGREQPKPILMTISLAGSPGERSGGMVAAGGRPVEEVAPPPKRPVPIPAAPPKKASVIATSKTPLKTPPKPADTSATPSNIARPPTTGAQVTRGTSVADTGATGQGTGLTFGGGAGGAALTLDSDFCCPEWASELQRRISANWDRYRIQPETGTTVLVIEIRKDGTFTTPVIETSSGSVLLDIASKAAFDKLTLPPLPKEYPADKLKVHLTFPYVR